MKNILLIAFCMLGFLVSAQDMDCQQFKDGLFVLKSDLGTFLITRSGNRQIETSTNEKGKVILEVEWINECTYTLKLIKEKGKKMKTTFPEGFKLIVEIIEINGNSYTQVTTANMADFEIEADMVKVESFSSY